MVFDDRDIEVTGPRESRDVGRGLRDSVGWTGKTTRADYPEAYKLGRLGRLATDGARP